MPAAANQRPLAGQRRHRGRRTSRWLEIIEEENGLEIPELAEVPRSARQKAPKH